jgi:YesN/AraC family two-component response regulator
MIGALKNMKVLLVDDDETIRISMAYFFKNKTAFFKAVESAELGLEAIQNDGPVDIIIADYRLPGMNGISFLDTARKICPDVLTVMITAYNSPELASKAVTHGINKLVQKPFTASTIINTLHSICATA